MSLLAVNSLAAYAAWGVLTCFIPVIRWHDHVWRLPPWLRVLAIAGIAYGMDSIPARMTRALACAALVLFAMIIMVRLGAVLPEPYSIILPGRSRRPPASRADHGYSPSQEQPGRRVPRL